MKPTLKFPPGKMENKENGRDAFRDHRFKGFRTDGGDARIILSQTSSEIAITPEWFQEFNNYRFRYQFNQKSLIGQGSFGKVYRCHSQLDKQFYCIKKIEVRNKSDGLHEIQALAEISKIYHPNIVRYFGSWMEAMPTKKSKLAPDNVANSDDEDAIEGNNNHQNGSSSFNASSPATRENLSLMKSLSSQECFESQIQIVLYLQMELCESSLAIWLEERNCKGVINVTESLHITKQIISAVAFIHSKNIIHRDLRPPNIFINSSNLEIKIGDFGISATPFTRPYAESDMGVYYYLPPENVISPKFDVFSTGIVLYEVLTVFSTSAERHYVLKNIKETGGIPYTGSQAKIYYNISCMVSHDPDNRPDLREIIDVLSNIETNKMLLRDYHLEVQRLSARVKYLESLLSEKKIEFE